MAAAARFTIVLPCYNESARIVSSLVTLESWFGAFATVLVIDDGSVDDTWARIERYRIGHGQVRAWRLVSHRGKGAAVRSSLPLVETERVVFVDADLAFDRDSIQRAVDALDAADMAIGNRRHDRSRYSVPVRLFGFLYRRHLLGLAFNAFVRTVLPVGVKDTQCGLKAFRRGCLARMEPALSTDGFALDVELLVVSRALDLRLAEVPVSVRYESARSSVRLLVNGWEMVRDVLTVAIRRARGQYNPARLRDLTATAAAGQAPGQSTIAVGRTSRT
jgi:glycosyltransferase involved in cell wall biosynthesis